jgi:hypothetical protein
MLDFLSFVAGYFVGMWIFGYIFGFLAVLGTTLNGKGTNSRNSSERKTSDDK